MSTPMSAAGTSPKKDSAEKRPPMDAGLRKVRRKPVSVASFSSGVPGVGDGHELHARAAARPPASTWARKKL